MLYALPNCINICCITRRTRRSLPRRIYRSFRTENNELEQSKHSLQARDDARLSPVGEPELGTSQAEDDLRGATLFVFLCPNRGIRMMP